MPKHIRTTIETVEDVRSRQVIWAEWMQIAVAGLNDDDFVEVTTSHTPFGRYCIGIEPVSEVSFTFNKEGK